MDELGSPEAWEEPEEEAPFDRRLAGRGAEAPAGETADAWEQTEEVEDDGPDVELEEAWAEDEPALGGTIRAGLAVLERVPLLRRHEGIGPDLILAWNDMAAAPGPVDVVVHLHGFALRSGTRLHLVRDVKPRSGLDWSDPTGADRSPGRVRPTLALLPRGSFYGGKTDRGYHFPALTAGDGLERLVELGLAQLDAALGTGPLPAGRLVLTAHSGGGAALLKLLGRVDPHEVHVFDGLYQDPGALSRWAAARIARDQAAIGDAPGSIEGYMRERGGALRVLHRSGTGRHSRAVAEAIGGAMEPDSPLRRWYRVERTATGHVRIPPEYGWRLLADASADLPGVPYVPAAGHGRPGASAKEAWDEELEGAAGVGLRQRIAVVATQEWERWRRGAMKERAGEATPILQEYYRIGVGKEVGARELQDPDWQAAHPWSAVFVSYVMRRAGAGDAFRYATAHASYVCAARKARMRAGGPDPTMFQAFRIGEAVPEVGDIVCKDRKRDGACSETTYDGVCGGGRTHGDVVVAIDRARNQLRVIGGNVQQSVADKVIPLSPDGHLPERARDGCRWIAVLKPPGLPASDGAAAS